MINRVILHGRLTKPPELRYTPSGVAVATFVLAVNRNFSNGNGEREADFINVVAWRQLAELAANYLEKGQDCMLEGRLQTRSYDDKEGKRQYITEVVADAIDFGAKATGAQNSQAANNNVKPNDPFTGNSQTIDIKDDDLPF